MEAEEHDLLEETRALIPVLAERAAVTNAARDVPPETIADFHRIGILRITQPRRFGGLQLRYSLFSRIVECLVDGCASSAWVYAVLGEHQWLLASYPVTGADRRVGRRSAGAGVVVAGATHGGPARRRRLAVERTVSVLQRQHARALGDHRRIPRSGRDPESVGYLLVPFTEIEIIDDWHVLGLAGTGSRSLLLRDVFVPEHRCALLSEMHAGTPPGATVHPDYPMVRAPRGLFVNYSLPPVAIALGNRALAVAMTNLRERVSRGMTRKADSEYVQITVAEAAAAIDAATRTMHSGRAAAEVMVGNGEPIPEEYVLRTRRDMTFAQHQVQWAVEKLVEVCGARSVYDADPLATIRRDILTVLTHIIASRQLAMRAWGRRALDVG